MTFASIPQLRQIIKLVDELDDLFEVVVEYGHERDFMQYTQPIRESAYTALKFRESHLTTTQTETAQDAT